MRPRWFSSFIVAAGLAGAAAPVLAAAPPPGGGLVFEEISVPRGIPIDVGGGAQFQAFDMVAPAGTHPWVMVGDYRSNPGGVSQVVVYTAPAESPRTWSITAFTGEEVPMSARATAQLADGSLLVVGSVDTDAGPVPATWTFDGTALTPPTVVGPTDQRGRLTLATLDPVTGDVVALVERYRPGTQTQPELARRAADGTWTFLPIAVDARNAEFTGISVTAAAIVVTGAGTERADDSGIQQAMAFVSTDRGATFTRADTSTMRSAERGTRLGNVIAGPGGFYASACLAGTGAIRSGIARSSDGHTWTEYAFTGPPLFPIHQGGCSDIAVDADGGVWVVAATQFYSVFYRVLNGAVDRFAASEVLDEQGPVSEDNANAVRFALDGSRLAMAVPQYGGPVTGFVGLDATANLTDYTFIDAAGMAPVNHEVITDVAVVNDQANVVGIQTFPYQIPFEAGTNYVERTFPFVLDVNGVGVPAPDATPVDPSTEAGLDGVVTLAGSEVALTTIAEAGTADYSGALGDVVVSRRGTDGAWTPLETVLGGLGAQFVNDVAVVGGQIVGVGGEAVTDQATTVNRGNGFVLVGDGITFQRLDLQVSELSEALAVCAMPDGRALVLAYDHVSGRSVTALVDVATRTLTIGSPVIDPPAAVPSRCVAAREGALVEVTTDVGIALYQTRDGVSFARLDILTDDDTVLGSRSSAYGVAVVGITGPSDEDAFVEFGPSLTELQRVDVPSFRGPGIQRVDDVVVADGVLYAVGTINASPVVWPIAYRTT